jgi:GTP-binding protein
MTTQNLRNISIIAHVDHGKTTLMDAILKQTGVFSAHQATVERVMDSNALEREKGITITAKNASVMLGSTKVNIVDTPGHSDFGGEVERVLGSVDGTILLVDAVEGPLPQTRFVLSKAIKHNLKIVLMLNKLDRSELAASKDRAQDVINQCFDLFVELGASEEQCDFPVVYAVARQGWCTRDENEVDELLAGTKKGSLQPLFSLIQDYFVAPRVEKNPAFKMQLSNLAWSDYVGQLAIGKVVSGRVQKKDTIFRMGHDEDTGAVVSKRFQVSNLFVFDGLSQREVDSLETGDIGVLAGCDEVQIGDTLASDASVEPFARMVIEPPTLKMSFTINTSPLSGRDGEAIQSRRLRDRLLRECRSNVSLRFEEAESSDQFFLLGRGELQFAVFMETLRREGIEFMVGRPVVLYKKDEDGNVLEPIEEAVLDMPEECAGEVTEMFQGRKGIMQSFENIENGRVRLVFSIPTRCLIGTRSRYLTLTKGTGLFSTKLLEFAPYKGDLLARKNGALIADRAGKCTDYALSSIENLGVLFVKPGHEVYEGLVIGECSRENDINVNPVRPKKLTNVRSVSSDGLILLSGTRDMSLEQMIEWLDEDEWIECTPKNIRIRKKILAANGRSVIRKLKE